MADQTEIATVLPKELRLGVPPKMPQARSYLFRQQSTLAEYNPGNTIQINIPRLQRSYLRKDSYLRFRMTGGFTKKYSWDGLVLDTAGAFGFFEKLEIFDYLGSTVLESISGIPQLTALLLDLGLKEVFDSRNGNCSMGLAPDYSFSGDSAIGSTVDPAAPGRQVGYIMNTGRVLPPSSGDWVVPPTNLNLANVSYSATPPAITVPFAREFAIPLPSFLGFLSEKMVPLHNGFTIVLTVANKRTPFFVNQITDLVVTGSAAATPVLAGLSSTTNTYTDTDLDANLSWRLDNVYMNCQILELGPVAESMILSSSQGSPLVVHTKSMRNYVGNVKGGTSTISGPSEFTLNMNLNVASLTNILWIMRSADQLDSLNLSSYGNRTRNFLQRWQFQYGSTTLPQSNGIQAMGSSLPNTYGKFDTSTLTDSQKYRILSGNGQEAFEELMKSRPLSLHSNRIVQGGYVRDSKFNAKLGTIDELDLVALFPSYASYFNIGRFAAGLNLQLANGKDGQIISGLNTNGMNTSIRGTFHPNYLNWMDTVRIDAWAEYDAFINISPGIATTVSF